MIPKLVSAGRLLREMARNSLVQSYDWTVWRHPTQTVTAVVVAVCAGYVLWTCLPAFGWWALGALTLFALVAAATGRAPEGSHQWGLFAGVSLMMAFLVKVIVTATVPMWALLVVLLLGGAVANRKLNSEGGAP